MHVLFFLFAFNLSLHRHDYTAMSGYSGAHLTLVDTTVTNNTATGSGGGIALSSSAKLTVTRGEITKNKASQGGGLHADSSTIVTIDACSMSGNQADYGGGVSVAGADTVVALNNVLILSNSATVASGGGLWVASGEVTLTSSVVAFNSANGPSFNDITFDVLGASSTCETRGGCIYSSNYPR
jgi:parallel beta-helix repeat protein